MELSEKLQALRTRRGLTQEQLAEQLFVSRTAVSKWESGRGAPSIDSLRAISRFFGVTIDELLSSEELVSLAEAERQADRARTRGMLLGTLDLSALLLIVLPLCGRRTGDVVLSVCTPLSCWPSTPCCSSRWRRWASSDLRCCVGSNPRGGAG